MKEQLISFETAKLAKDKGFNWETSYGYDVQHKDLTDHTIIHNEGNYMWSEELETEIYYIEDYSSDRRHNYIRDIYDWNNSKYYYSAPTQSLLQTWIEATFNIVIYLKPSYDHLSCELKGFYFTLNNKNGGEVDQLYFSLDDKYKGLEIMLKGALKLITKQ